MKRLLFYILWFRAMGLLRREEGQTTAEYALVIVAAAIAVVLIAWRVRRASCSSSSTRLSTT